MVLRDGLLDCTQVLYQFTLEALNQQTAMCMGFFPSNAFMAFARSFNMFYCMLQIGIN